MKTAELKSKLHEKIDKIEDDEYLEQLMRSVDNELNPEFKLEQWELDIIEESEKQIEQGLVISKEDADKKIEEWLKK